MMLRQGIGGVFKYFAVLWFHRHLSLLLGVSYFGSRGFSFFVVVIINHTASDEGQLFGAGSSGRSRQFWSSSADGSAAQTVVCCVSVCIISAARSDNSL